MMWPTPRSNHKQVVEPARLNPRCTRVAATKEGLVRDSSVRPGANLSQSVQALRMRLSMTSLYARTYTRRGCQLSRVDGHSHDCSPLCTWANSLRGRLKIEYTNDTNASVLLRATRFDALKLTFDAGSNTTTVWRCLEAIDLVLLAAQLDPVHAWEHLIPVRCEAINFIPSLIQPREIVPRLRLVLKSKEELSKCMKWLRIPWLRSPTYRLTRKWLLREQHSAGRYFEGPLQSIPVLIEWDIDLTSSRLATSTTNQLCNLAARARAKQARFQLIEINCHFSVRRLAKRKLLESTCYQIPDIYNCSFSEAELLRLRDAGIRMRFSAFVARWYRSGTEALRGDIANPTEVFKFHGSLSDDWWFLLREAGCTKEVHLCMHGRHEHRAIAAALLDPRSPTSVERVFLRSTMSNESITDALRVLKSDDPFALLGWGQLTASRYRPTARSHLRSLGVLLNEAFLQEKSLFFELLRIIGSRIETLSIKCYGSVCLSEEDLVMLLTSCPKLQCLSLCDVSLTSLEPIMSAYNMGLCPSLASFIHRGHVDDQESIASLLEACNDPHQQVHRTLRDVEIADRIEYNELILPRIFEAIRCNRTLRHVALEVPKSCYPADSNGELLRAMRISTTPVLVQSARLPLTQKLAFLSALRFRLDQDTCRRVLEFSCGMEPRRMIYEEWQKDLQWETRW